MEGVCPSDAHPLLFPVVGADGGHVCMPAEPRRVPGVHQTSQGYLQLELWREVVRGRVRHHREYLHRLVCWLFQGRPQVSTLQCAHLCGRPNCLNPHHLAWVLPETNAAMAKWHALPGCQGHKYPNLNEEGHPREYDEEYVLNMHRLLSARRRTGHGRGRPEKKGVQ